MWKEKLGNYLIDVSKYFLTGVFVASLVKDLEEIRWLIYVLSGSVVSTQFRASPFERALFSALNRVSLKN